MSAVAPRIATAAPRISAVAPRIATAAPLALAGALLAVACSPAPPPPEPPPQPRVIESPGAPAAIGPYSQGIQVGNTLYLAGQLGMDPATGEMVEGGIEAQTHQVMRNLGAVLEAAGFTFSDVVQSQVFLAELDEFGAMNQVYGSYFPDRTPTRATVQVARLPRDARVEILMVAVRGG